MKAVILEGTGGTECLKMKTLDMPVIKDGEVLIKVKSISINPVDIKTRTGKGVYGRIKDEHPIILGWDVSGEVIETANGVSKFKKGDQVFGMINFPGHGKAYAEYAAASEKELALKPETISHEETAAGTLAALTAWRFWFIRQKSRKAIAF
jgi:NADPH:quinone reductase-like Zn-dependent oxidoreductase